MTCLLWFWLGEAFIRGTGYTQALAAKTPPEYAPRFQLTKVNLTENITSAVRCTDSTTHRNRFTIGFLPALHGVGQPKHYVGAFLYALQTINSDWQGDREKRCLIYMYNDTGGDTQKAIKAMTQQLYNGCIAFIGAENNCALEATIAGAWQRPLLSYQCSDSVVSNKDKYPTFARTLPSTSKVSKSLISIMKYFRWTSFTMIVGTSRNWEEAAQTLRDLAHDNNIKINAKETFEEPYWDAYYYSNTPNEDSSKRIIEIIENTYMKTRIYVFLGDDHAFIDFVREMERRGLNNEGKYVLLSVQDKAYETRNKGKYLLKYHEKSPSQPHVDAFRPVLMLMQRPTNEEIYTEFLNQTISLSSSRDEFNVPKLPIEDSDIIVPAHASNLYDAVRVYARALKEVLDAGGDPLQGERILAKITARPYNSIRGYEMFIDENGDAESNYTVVALKTDPGESLIGHSLQPVGNFTAVGIQLPHFNYDDSIDWISGTVPKSDPHCGFNGEKCRLSQKWVVAIVLAALAFILPIAICGCRHYIYEQKLSSLLWKIDYKDLVMTLSDVHDPLPTDKVKHRPLPKSHAFGLFSSDDSRDDIKVNHKSAIRVASFKGTLVAVRMLRHKHVEITRSLQKELHLLKEMSHDNINRFHGACIDPPSLCIVNQFCARGSLEDILKNDNLTLDDVFIASLVFDLIKGMIFLHDSEIISHGNLKSSNCLVDSRWVLQIAEFGLHSLRAADVLSIQDEDAFYSRLLWRSPELLRDPLAPPQGTQKGDVYSFAVILYEILGRSGPWGKTTYSCREIVDKVKCPPEGWVLRPDSSLLKCEDFVLKCMQDCWHEEPEGRPEFKLIRMRLKPMLKGLRSNIFDNMLAIMEKYANNLEAVVAERTIQLTEEKRKTESLLLRMLPRPVADQLKRGENVIPEHYDCVTIYFSDICGFTSLSASSTPMQVVDMLNDLYTTFDSIIGEYDVYKVETIGDAYVVASGLPLRNGNNHAGEIASMSLHLLRAISSFQIPHRPEQKLSLRVGIHSGSCVAGVVGLKMPRYCLFGDTVNTASRMESNGLPFRIHCSSECHAILTKLGGYILEERGYVSMKGKGAVFTYFLLDEDKSERLRRISVDTPAPEPTIDPKQCLISKENSEIPANGSTSLLSFDGHHVESDLGNIHILLNNDVRYCINDSPDISVNV